MCMYSLQIMNSNMNFVFSFQFIIFVIILYNSYYLSIVWKKKNIGFEMEAFLLYARKSISFVFLICY